MNNFFLNWARQLLFIFQNLRLVQQIGNLPMEDANHPMEDVIYNFKCTSRKNVAANLMKV